MIHTGGCLSMYYLNKMVRFDYSANTDFVQFIGPYTLAPKEIDWQGDNQKRMVDGTQVLSTRAHKLHVLKQNTYGPSAEASVSEPARYRPSLSDPHLSQGLDLPKPSQFPMKRR